jgi:hypothetical protein
MLRYMNILIHLLTPILLKSIGLTFVWGCLTIYHYPTAASAGNNEVDILTFTSFDGTNTNLVAVNNLK